MQFTLLLTIALVVMVIFRLPAQVLGHGHSRVWRLPLALIGTFGIMKLVGFSLDNLSLMALTISTGFVVDDAIVMIENIVRFIEAGETPLEAALKGAKQIGFTVISLSVSLIAVFIPLLFMTGIVGRLFREFAITLSIAVAVSAVVSLTLTPMMCAKLLRSEGEDEQEHQGGSIDAPSEYLDHALANWYERGLRWVLRHQRFILNVAIATLVATILALHPRAERTAPATGHRRHHRRNRCRADHLVQRDGAKRARGFRYCSARSGCGQRLGVGWRRHSQRDGQHRAALYRPQAARPAQANAAENHRPPARMPRAMSKASRSSCRRRRMCRSTAASAARNTNTPCRMPTKTELSRVDAETAAETCATAGTERRRQRSAARTDCSSTSMWTAKRPRASTSSPQAIDDTLYDAFGQRQVSTIFTQLNQYRVILEAEPQFQNHPMSLDKIYVKSTTGQMVPLSAFATMHDQQRPADHPAPGPFPAVTLSFNLRRGSSLGAAVKAIQKAEQRNRLAGHGRDHVLRQRGGIPLLA